MHHVVFCCRDVPVERLQGRSGTFKYVVALRSPILTPEGHLFLSPHALRLTLHEFSPCLVPARPGYGYCSGFS
jgi:hypothetical protein